MKAYAGSAYQLPSVVDVSDGNIPRVKVLAPTINLIIWKSARTKNELAIIVYKMTARSGRRETTRYETYEPANNTSRKATVYVSLPMPKNEFENELETQAEINAPIIISPIGYVIDRGGT